MSLETEELEVKTTEFATKLGEKDNGPKYQIRQIIQHAGLEFAERILQETLDVEEHGGMLTSDGTRRRTAGGVFFYIARGKLEPSVRTQIFPGYGEINKGESIDWDTRFGLIEAARDTSEYGELTMAPRITLIGRPKSIQQLDNSVMVMFEHLLENLSYNRGIPMPPVQPTYFTVYMGKGQWERVEKQLKKNPADNIIIEGTCILDNETGTIAVMAMIVNTKMVEKRIRKEQMNAALTGPDNETNVILSGRPSVPPNTKKQQNDAKKQKIAPNQKSQKPNKPQNQSENRFEAKADAPETPTPQVAPVTEGLSKLQQLEQAANTLRERISAMEAKNQPGIAMTRKLLENTERQIELLKRDS